MSDLRPRLIEMGTDRERALLRAGVDEAPSAESVRAAARALGVVPRAALLVVAIAALRRLLRGSLALTAVAPALVVAGAVVAVTWTGARRPRALPAPTAFEAAPLAAPLPANPPARRPAFVPNRGPDRVTPPVSAAPAPRSIAPVATDRTGPLSPADNRLDEQVAKLNRARSLLASGDPSGALPILRDYEREFPRGAFSEESALLRIQALIARGDRALATSAGSRFLAEHPRSMHASKVRAILDDAGRPN